MISMRDFWTSVYEHSIASLLLSDKVREQDREEEERERGGKKYIKGEKHKDKRSEGREKSETERTERSEEYFLHIFCILMFTDQIQSKCLLKVQTRVYKLMKR